MLVRDALRSQHGGVTAGLVCPHFLDTAVLAIEDLLVTTLSIPEA